MSDNVIKVLIVEDNPGDLLLLRTMLQSVKTLRFEIAHASRLSAALEEIRRRPDVALLDLNLPDSQDLETLRRVRAADPFVPIIVLTGMDDREKAVQALANGAQDYLVKGKVDGHLLGRAIERRIAPASERGESDSARQAG